MSLAQLINRPCTVYRLTEGAPDEYGDATLGHDSGTATVCELQQQAGVRGSGTSLEDLALTESRWVIYLPAGTVIGAQDYVDVEGVRYDVESEPDEYRNPRDGREVYVMARARRTE